MDDTVPTSELPNQSSRASDSYSSHQGLQFDGFHTGNGADSATKAASFGEGMGREVPGSNAAKYRLLSPARLPISRSTCLTIPPGLSPTVLLDSPVLLSVVKAEPSPTTGTFSASMVMHDTVKSETLTASRVASNHSTICNEDSRDFEFKPHSRLASVSGPLPLGKMDSAGLNCMKVPASLSTISHPVNPQCSKNDAKAAQATEALPDDLHLVEHGEGHTSSAIADDQKKSAPLGLVEKSSEDGYNWRKYGQKHVKGSEFPRSYYKCTHPTCEVKKLLERSHDGRITEILYKGKHDHPKPQPNRRLGVGALPSGQKDERSDTFHSATKVNLLNGVGAVHQNEPIASPEFSPTNITDSVGVDINTAKNADVTNEDDPELKRRKIDYGGTDLTSAGKMARDQRVVVQTVSEVDILDDGYRWRKYGQKVVKGNPNPRSYYKCTNAGCQVRKHVERASHDPKAVITTYEGKHNHDVPSSLKTHDHNTAGSTSSVNEFSNHNCRRPLSVGVPGYHHSEKSDVISLNLGVGVTSNSTNTTNETQRSLENQQLRNQIQMTATGQTW